MSGGRAIWAGLQLLDRQMLCHGERMAGCVDDLELTPSAEDPGQLLVTAIVSGPGALLYRLKRRRLGRWLQRASRRLADEREDPVLIPFGRVAAITSHVVLDVDYDELATSAGDRWVRDHVIGDIPGSSHSPDGGGDDASE